MKKTLIVLCAAIALIGCDRNRGGASNISDRDTGYGASRSMNRDNSSLSPSSNISTNTNNATGTSSTDNTTPKN